MPLVDLRLQHFRSYDDASFELSPGVNVIVGPNASGKTNLLEAVLVVARGKSYRAKDNELVQFGQSWVRLDARDETNDLRTVKLKCIPEGVCAKSFEIGGKTYTRLSSQKSLPVVLFEPDHLLMLSGSPELRRSYLDDLLEQLRPGFGAVRRQYKRALMQRNALLKQDVRSARMQLFVWNVRLSELAGYLVRERTGLLEEINAIASDIYSAISNNKQSKVELIYTSLATSASASYESSLLGRLEQVLERDMRLGFTTVGPHRDDFQVRLNGYVSQETASRGENRTVILTLKVIELQLIKALRERSPILLLDDVFSELDGRRRHALTDYLRGYQTFITTTDADVVVRFFSGISNVIPMQR